MLRGSFDATYREELEEQREGMNGRIDISNSYKGIVG